MTRVVQVTDGRRRAVALVDEPVLRLVSGPDSVYALAAEAASSGTALTTLIRDRAVGDVLDYDAVYQGRATWRLLVPVDDPVEPARCLVSGTGLTHLGSAKDRNTMHESDAANLTDSMKMFKSGLDGGRPAPGDVGVAPEWFYKGPGTILRAHDEPLVVPAHAEDGGEEAEVAGVYLIDASGQPRRIGMTPGNEFSDHVFEKKNYLNLAGSKLRSCAIGPELVIQPEFQSNPGPRHHRARGPRALDQGHRDGRRRDVPQPGEHRAPPFQVRRAPAPRRSARPLLRCAQLELRRGGASLGRGRDGG